MQLRVVSDLHLEFWADRLKNTNLAECFIPPDSSDADTILVIAGDLVEVWRINKDSRYFDFLKEVSQRFKRVIYVMGNHDYYHSNIKNTYDSLKEKLFEFYNITLLENEAVQIDDYYFIGATLWTDYDNQNPSKMLTAIINDFSGIIRNGDKLYTTQDSVTKHLQSKMFIREAVEYANDKKLKSVVVTHHAPSYGSMHEKYSKPPYSNYNCCFLSDMDNFIKDLKPSTWIHGHVHDSFDYRIEETRIVCNPVGYPGEYGSNNYEPFKIISV